MSLFRPELKKIPKRREVRGRQIFEERAEQGDQLLARRNIFRPPSRTGASRSNPGNSVRGRGVVEWRRGGSGAWTLRY